MSDEEDREFEEWLRRVSANMEQALPCSGPQYGGVDLSEREDDY